MVHRVRAAETAAAAKVDAALQAAEEQDADLRRVLKTARISRANADLRAENDRLLAEVHKLQAYADHNEAFLEHQPVIERVTASPKARNPAAFVLLVSDTHVGETVDPRTVGNKNAYNPAIARRRFESLAEGSLWMIESWRSGKKGYGWGIEKVVCWLGGDIITGHLHDDQRESNSMHPTEELLFAFDRCVALLESLAAHPGIKEVIVPTSWGNHGRLTIKPRVATAASTSLEWLLYMQLARHFEKHPKIRLQVNRNTFSYLEVMGLKLRFTHGDKGLKYAGGIGGLTVPLVKWLHRLNQTKHADVTNIGHWHQYLDIGSAVVNNSLIGWNAYAQDVIAAPYAPASQVCYLVDAKRGKRMSTEIVVR